MPKNVVTLASTYAAPIQVIKLPLSSAVYSSMRGLRLTAETDNTSALHFELVVSRDSTPLASGSIVTEPTLQRGDPLIVSAPIPSLGSTVLGQLSGDNFILDDAELLDDNTYCAVRVIGLGSGKVANFLIEVDTADLTKTSPRDSEYLRQVLRFQQAQA